MQHIHLPKDLPDLEPIVKAHGEKIFAFLKKIIADEGALNFARYMELALYAPGLGYYSAGLKKLGAAGDFITAPELSSLFSRCLAQQCQQVLSGILQGSILELGAGSGIMAADILLALEQLQQLPEFYYILEISADLRERQHNTIKTHCPHLLEKVIWLDALPSDEFQGIIIANEVIDAMPVHRFQANNTEIKEFYVTCEHNELKWQLEECGDPTLLAQIRNLQKNYFGPSLYESEINTLLPAWINSLSKLLKKGLILLIDYGFPRHEYYHPHRHQGTLMCHYQHRAHSNPLILPGLQDITAHVDFTAVAENAHACTLEIAGYTTQAAFLLNLGLTDFIAREALDTPQQQLLLSQQIQKLTSPSEMGELFKVIALTRDFTNPLLGFIRQDIRGRL